MPGTPTKAQLSREEKRAQVLAYHALGKGGREIGRLVDMGESSVRAIVARWGPKASPSQGESPAKAPVSLADHPRSGRPPKWSARYA